MTSAFGGQHSIQLSYGCQPRATYKAKRARNAKRCRARSLYFVVLGPVAGQHRQMFGQMRQRAVRRQMQGLGDFLDMFRG